MKHILVCLILAAALTPAFGGQKKTEKTAAKAKTEACCETLQTSAKAKSEACSETLQTSAKVSEESKAASSACSVTASESSCCSTKMAKKFRRSGSAKGAYMAMR